MLLARSSPFAHTAKWCSLVDELLAGRADIPRINGSGVPSAGETIYKLQHYVRRCDQRLCPRALFERAMS